MIVIFQVKIRLLEQNDDRNTRYLSGEIEKNLIRFITFVRHQNHIMMNNCSAINPSAKVSVIIPVYNTATYLHSALDSICNQTLKDLEIILINDGSTDNSQYIIEKYARKDNRIKYLIQPNQRQGVARNNGLQLATGQYIYFMDSDDILDIDALRQCYEMCERKELDFVTFDAKTIHETSTSSGTFNYCRKGKIDEQKIWDGIELMHYELEHEIFYVVPWLCFTKHSFLKQYFGGFPSGIIHEDTIFVVQIMLNAHRVGYIPQPFFKRRVRNSSTMAASFSMHNIEGYTLVCTQIRSWTQQHVEWSAIIDLYLRKTLNSVIWLGHKMKTLEKIETYCRFQRLHLSQYVKLKNWLVFWLKN